MGWNNNYNNQGGYRPSQNNGGYGGNGGYHQQRPKKRSGAKEGLTRSSDSHDGGKLYIRGWCASKRAGMVKFFACENKKSVRSESGRGNRFVTLMVEVIWTQTGQKHLELVNYNMTSGKALLERLGWVISTKAPNGGYFGPYKKR